MKFGLGLPAIILYPAVMSRWEPDAHPSVITDVARRADELGYDFATVPEHIVIPDEMAEVMGKRFPESFTAAAYLAGATNRLKLLTYVLVLPYRNPIMLAKQVATVDFLSGGRVILGAAAGHMEREFEMLGVPFAERGAITDEYLKAMKVLWTSETPAFKGRYVQFERIAFEPKPTQKPHPPVWIGGNSKPAMRRAATYGDGWIPYLIRRKNMPECLDYIREQPGFRDNPRTFDVIVPLATFQIEDYSHKELGKTMIPRGKEQTIEEIGLWQEAGVTGVLINMPRTPTAEAYIEWVEWFAAEIMPSFSDQ